jgi:hypothetical protein
MGSGRFAHLAHMRLSVGLVVLFVLACVMPATANAAASTGAQVINVPKECLTFEAGTVCASQHSVFNVAATPSGQTSVVSNVRSTSTFTGAGAFAGCSDTFNFTSHQHYVVGEETSFAYRQLLAIDNCGGQTYECALTSQFHFAGGQVQYDRSKLDCTPT